MLFSGSRKPQTWKFGETYKLILQKPLPPDMRYLQVRFIYVYLQLSRPSHNIYEKQFSLYSMDKGQVM